MPRRSTALTRKLAKRRHFGIADPPATCARCGLAVKATPTGPVHREPRDASNRGCHFVQVSA